MQGSNKYKITGLKSPAFITMNDSMYEGQEGEKREASFKQKFKLLLLNIGQKLTNGIIIVFQASKIAVVLQKKVLTVITI